MKKLFLSLLTASFILLIAVTTDSLKVEWFAWGLFAATIIFIVILELRDCKDQSPSPTHE